MRAFKSRLIIILLYCLFVSSEVYLYSKVPAKWTFLVYMEADNNLAPFSKHNLNDMLKANSSENLNVLVQCNQFYNKGLYRYKVSKNVLELDSTLPVPQSYDCVKELVEAFRWAHTKYPADHYALVFWNHGVGIIDPVWGVMNPWIVKNKDLILSNPRAYISEVISAQTNQADKAFLEEFSPLHRGILFNESSKTYMNNQQLSESLMQINKILNRKIDVIGMDACLMAMIEVAYQIKNYADILVASQDVERAEGWYYSAFLSQLSNGHMNSMDLAQSIVLSYDLYYKPKAQIYTQSAMNLSNIDLLKKNLDQVVLLSQKCQGQFGSIIKEMICSARSNCLQFNTPSYIDLYTFYSEFYKQLKVGSIKNGPILEQRLSPSTPENNAEFAYTVLPDNYYQENVVRNDDNNEVEQELEYDDVSKRIKPNITSKMSLFANSKDIEALKNELSCGMKLIETCIVANSCGKMLDRAKGISIYYPSRYSRLDISYLHTDFARDSMWIEFLKSNM